MAELSPATLGEIEKLVSLLAKGQIDDIERRGWLGQLDKQGLAAEIDAMPAPICAPTAGWERGLKSFEVEGGETVAVDLDLLCSDGSRDWTLQLDVDRASGSIAMTGLHVL